MKILIMATNIPIVGISGMSHLTIPSSWLYVAIQAVFAVEFTIGPTAVKKVPKIMGAMVNIIP